QLTVDFPCDAGLDLIRLASGGADGPDRMPLGARRRNRVQVLHELREIAEVTPKGEQLRPRPRNRHAPADDFVAAEVAPGGETGSVVGGMIVMAPPVLLLRRKGDRARGERNTGGKRAVSSSV